jgi:uncharacterized protein
MKIQVRIRVYEELNFFLPKERRKKDFIEDMEIKIPIQQLIEKLSIPLSHVDLIMVNGCPVPLNHQLNDNDEVSIYPAFETFDISSVTKIRERPLRNLAFICDVHLGKLAKYMRMLGLNVDYQNNYTASKMVYMSVKQNKIILTKGQELLKNKLITRGYCVKETTPKLQLQEVVSYFDLHGLFFPMSRCLRCNQIVEQATKDSVRDRVPASILEMHDKFTTCDGCGLVYWEGSHYRSMMAWIREIQKKN